MIRRMTAVLMGTLLLSGSIAAAAGRLAPPASLDCPRDRLTAFSGKVLAYRRGAETINLRLRTDEETTEAFTLKFPKTDGPESRLLLRGETFRPEDWGKIEKKPGYLRDGMRVIVWVCEGESRPVFDWRPGEETENPAGPPLPR